MGSSNLVVEEFSPSPLTPSPSVTLKEAGKFTLWLSLRHAPHKMALSALGVLCKEGPSESPAVGEMAASCDGHRLRHGRKQESGD